MVAPRVVTYMFIILIYIQIIRTTLNTYVNACGLFKQTKVCTIVEGIINLILSLIFVKYFGMAGVLFATIISLLIADFVIKPIVVKNNLKIFNMRQFYKDLIIYMIISCMQIALNTIIFKYQVNSILKWFGFSLIIFMINVVVTTICYKIFRKLEWLNSIKEMRKKHEDKYCDTSI